MATRIKIKLTPVSLRFTSAEIKLLRLIQAELKTKGMAETVRRALKLAGVKLGYRYDMTTDEWSTEK